MSPALRWGTIRPGPGNALPTDYTFTGQKLDARSGLMYYVARWYDPQVGRFLSPDSIVPEPGNPQSLTRFSYVANNPLRFVDPTGYAECAAGDMQCWQNEWYWKNRWYEAHGYGWNGEGWSKPINPKFADRGIMDEVLSEAGIKLVGGGGWTWPSKQWTGWTDDRVEHVARAVALFARKLSRGMEGLRTLFSNETVTMAIVTSSGPACGCSNPCAPPQPWSDGNTVLLPVGVFYAGRTDLHMIIVHELAHIVDWHSSVNGRAFSRAWSHPPITTYARDGGPLNEWERFAEAAAVYVIGPSYEDYAGKFLVDPTTRSFAGQMRDMQRLLEGWGW